LEPADAADVIEHMAPDERLFIFNLLTSEGAGEVLIEIEPPVQKQILADLMERNYRSIDRPLESLNVQEASELIDELLGNEGSSNPVQAQVLQRRRKPCRD